jgi:Na+/citrate or Na+/malate symporter
MIYVCINNMDGGEGISIYPLDYIYSKESKRWRDRAYIEFDHFLASLSVLSIFSISFILQFTLDFSLLYEYTNKI